MIRESISFIRNYDFFSKRIFLASMFVLGIYYLYWDFVPSTFSNLIATGILAFSFVALTAHHKIRKNQHANTWGRGTPGAGVSIHEKDPIPSSYFWGVVAPTLSIYILVSVISPQRLVYSFGEKRTFEFKVVRIAEWPKLWAPLCQTEYFATSEIRRLAGFCHIPEQISRKINVGDRLKITGMYLPKAGFIPARYRLVSPG